MPAAALAVCSENERREHEHKWKTHFAVWQQCISLTQTLCCSGCKRDIKKFSVWLEQRMNRAEELSFKSSSLNFQTNSLSLSTLVYQLNKLFFVLENISIIVENRGRQTKLFFWKFQSFPWVPHEIAQQFRDVVSSKERKKRSFEIYSRGGILIKAFK